MNHLACTRRPVLAVHSGTQSFTSSLPSCPKLEGNLVLIQENTGHIYPQAPVPATLPGSLLPSGESCVEETLVYLLCIGPLPLRELKPG